MIPTKDYYIVTRDTSSRGVELVLRIQKFY